METQRPPQPKAEKPFLAQLSLRRGGKKPYFVNVRLYPTSDIDDPRPFIARDLKGNEVTLTPKELEFAKTLAFPKR